MRIERIVPQVIEKVVKIEKIVEKESLETRNKLMEEERALLKKEIRIQFSEKILELEANIFAYQDLLIAKETEIKAYATELHELQTFKGGVDQTKLIESLKKLVAEKASEIEHLKTADIQVGGLPHKVYKKLSHINSEIESKMEIVHKNYKKEMTKQSESFLKEIEHIKKDKQKIIDSIPDMMKELHAKHKVEIE